jgi:hypothetical protein
MPNQTVSTEREVRRFLWTPKAEEQLRWVTEKDPDLVAVLVDEGKVSVSPTRTFVWVRKGWRDRLRALVIR